MALSGGVQPRRALVTTKLASDKRTQKALLRAAEEAAYVVDREQFGSELDAQQLAALTGFLADTLSDALLRTRLPEEWPC